jgi:hypothetical protein
MHSAHIVSSCILKARFNIIPRASGRVCVVVSWRGPQQACMVRVFPSLARTDPTLVDLPSSPRPPRLVASVRNISKTGRQTDQY